MGKVPLYSADLLCFSQPGLAMNASWIRFWKPFKPGILSSWILLHAGIGRWPIVGCYGLSFFSVPLYSERRLQQRVAASRRLIAPVLSRVRAERAQLEKLQGLT